MRRALAVTVGLGAAGAAVGAVLGAISLWIATSLLGVGPKYSDVELLTAGAEAGALTGTILAPLSAWALMRYVPLWRAIIEPGIATLLGSIAGSIVHAMLGGGEGLALSIIGAPIGFLVAALRLRARHDARHQAVDALSRG